MPRVKKNPDELLGDFETFRRTKADKEVIDKLVEASGLTRSDYLRRAAKNQKIAAPVTPLMSRIELLQGTLDLLIRDWSDRTASHGSPMVRA